MSEAVAVQAPLYRIIPGNEADHAFVYATWLRSYRQLSDFAKPIEKDVYFPHQHDRIQRLLERGRLDVAVLDEQDGWHTVIGYCVTDGLLLHWVYVKGTWRRMGIARALLASKSLQEFTHLTYDFDHLAKKHPQWKYNPYRAG